MHMETLRLSSSMATTLSRLDRLYSEVLVACTPGFPPASRQSVAVSEWASQRSRLHIGGGRSSLRMRRCLRAALYDSLALSNRCQAHRLVKERDETSCSRTQHRARRLIVRSGLGHRDSRQRPRYVCAYKRFRDADLPHHQHHAAAFHPSKALSLHRPIFL
ncbi:hypothetical protein FKP32DRAFT_1457325 [Trametes sanguinea]|nr:hypothetical protein FKP32DRAFT_1457325 [Trametes sanguinea]